MRKVLLGVKRYVYDEASFQASSRQLHKMTLNLAAERGIIQQLAGPGDRLNNWFTTFCTPAAKSGASAMRAYRHSNNDLAASIAGKRLSGQIAEILPSLKRERGSAVVVCVDDFVGTGRSAVSGLRSVIFPSLDDVSRDWRQRFLLVYAAQVGFETGLDYVREQVGDDVFVLCHHRLPDGARAFSPLNDLWDTDEDRLAARQIAEDIGKELVGEDNRLGFGSVEGLVVLRDNCPNDTLPILWSNGRYRGREWKAIFPRS